MRRPPRVLVSLKVIVLTSGDEARLSIKQISHNPRNPNHEQFGRPEKADTIASSVVIGSGCYPTAMIIWAHPTGSNLT
ncbi:hypothetical protein [Zavarzinella formosa]|uniref:hypothetical protein n=1 Tax=Zavarzinella formosa TaxID=360055 RepID=UPI0012FB898B|nr:hypothetical protein [Zavarzinella formosa]